MPKLPVHPSLVQKPLTSKAEENVHPLAQNETWVIMQYLKQTGALPEDIEGAGELEELEARFESTRDPFEKVALLSELKHCEMQVRRGLDVFELLKRR